MPTGEELIDRIGNCLAPLLMEYETWEACKIVNEPEDVVEAHRQKTLRWCIEIQIQLAAVLISLKDR